MNKNQIFLVEEKLQGKEFSLQVFSDGKSIFPMPLVRDYKRAYDGDKGLNTGSMGSYSLPDHNLPFLSKKDVDSALNILRKTIKALHKHFGVYYRGILYGQFMKTNYGIFLVEFNARFGDPEAINVLKLLETDFNKLCLNMIDGSMKSANFSSLATVCTYLVPEGYPTSPVEGTKITIEPKLDVDLYFASVYREKSIIKSTKSRAIALLSTGKKLEEAKDKVYSNLSKIKGKLFYRKDIGVLL